MERISLHKSKVQGQEVNTGNREKDHNYQPRTHYPAFDASIDFSRKNQ